MIPARLHDSAGRSPLPGIIARRAVDTTPRIASLTAFGTPPAGPAMHREFDPADEPFQPRSHLGLYLLTAVVGLLLLADLWPPLAAWLAGLGLELPTWPGREVFTVRLALIAAI